jgi:hypothetical protein
MRANTSINTDAQVRPAAALAPSLCAGYLQLQGLPHLSSKAWPSEFSSH